MRKRILSSLALWGCLVVLILKFKIHGAILILTLFSAGAHWELCHILKKAGLRVGAGAATLTGILLIPGAYYMQEPLLDITKNPWMAAATLGLTGVLLSWLLMLIVPPGKRLIRKALIPTALSVLYVPFLLHFFVHLCFLPNGLFLCIWVTITAKFTDMGALLTGKYLGRHKMAPRLSPKKTWEGAIGGTIVSVLAAVLVAYLANRYMELDFGLKTAACLALPISIMGQVGDLVESGFKRKANVKDSGNSIPGIGGTLDLMDSLILNAPLAYFLLSQASFGQP